MQLLNNTANNTASVDLAREARRSHKGLPRPRNRRDVSKDGCTALMFAAMAGHGPIVEELVKARRLEMSVLSLDLLSVIDIRSVLF